MRGELKLWSFPPLIPELQGEGDTQTDTGETGSDHAFECGTGGKNYIGNPPSPHTHTHDRHKHTQENEEEEVVISERKRLSVFTRLCECILRHHPVLSPQCGPQHYITLCFCVCRAGRMCASYSLLHCTHLGWQPMAKHCSL